MPPPPPVGALVVFEYTQTRRLTTAEQEQGVTLTEKDTRWRWALGTVLRQNPHARLVTLGCWDPPRRDGFTGDDERASFELDREIFKEEEALKQRREELEGVVRGTAEQARAIIARREETVAQLEAVQPLLDEAKLALNEINAEALRELRSYATPPDMVKKVLDAVTTLLGTPADTWAAMRTFIRADDLVSRIRDFSPKDIKKESAAKVEQMLAKDKTFTHERCSRASRAAGPMYLWVVANVQFAGVWQQMAPLLEELEQQRRKLSEAEDHKATCLVEVGQLEAKLRGLRERRERLLYGDDGGGDVAEGFDPFRSRPGVWRQRVDGREEHVVIMRSSILRVLEDGKPQRGTFALPDGIAPTGDEPAESAEAALQGQLREVEREAAETDKKLKRAEAKLQSLQQDASSSSRDAAGRIDELENRVETLTQELAEARAAAAATREEADGATARHAMQIEVLQREAKEAADREAELKTRHAADLQHAEDALNDVKGSVDQLAAEIDEAHHERDTAEARSADLVRQLEELRLELGEARGEAAIAKQHLEEQQREAAKAARDEPAQSKHVDPTPAPSAAATADAARSAAARVPVDHKATQTEEIDELDMTDDGASSIGDDDANEVSRPTTTTAPAASANASFRNYRDDEVDEEGPPEDHDLPFDMIPRSAYLVTVFPVDKLVASKIGQRKLRRSWVLDYYRQQVHNCGGNGQISKSFDVKALTMVEKDEGNPLKLRLLFSGVGHDHSLMFLSPYARERFVELVQMLRPAITVRCPELMPAPELDEDGVDMGPQRCKATIRCGDAPELDVDVVGGKITVGGCGRDAVVDVSVNQHEPCNVWIGTHNLDYATPVSDSYVLDSWIPRGAADVYVVSLQRMGDDPEALYELLRGHLGPNVLQASSVETEKMGMAVFVRRSVLPKISNCEGSKTVLDADGHGALALSFHLLDTRVTVMSAYLPTNIGPSNRTKMLRTAALRLQVGISDSDVTATASHVFLTGDFGYSLVCDQTELSRAVGAGDYPRLMKSDGFTLMRSAAPSRPFSVYQEHSVHFGPTAFTEKGAGYPARVLHFSPGAPYAALPQLQHGDAGLTPLAPPLRCVAYSPAEEMIVSPFLAVAAMYKLHARRPSVAAMQEVHAPTYKVLVTQLSITTNFAGDDDVDVRTPVVRAHSAVGGSIVSYKRSGTTGTGDGTWRFAPADAVNFAMEITTNVMPVIDAETIVFTLIDDGAAAGSKCVGVAQLPLRGRVGNDAGPPSRPASFTCPLIRAGGVAGMCVGQLCWEKSTVMLTDTMM